METFIAIYQEFVTNLGLPVTETTLGLVVFLVVATVLALTNSGLKSGQYTKLKAEKASELAELNQELDSSRQQLGEMKQRSQQINESLRKQLRDLRDKGAIASPDNLDTLPDTDLIEKSLSVLSELATSMRLLKDQCHQYKHRIDHLEIDKMATFNELNHTKQSKITAEQQLSLITLKETRLINKCQQLESDLATVHHQQLATEQQLVNQQTELAAKQNQMATLEENGGKIAQQLSQASEKIAQLQADLAVKNQQQQDSPSSAELGQLRQTHEKTAKELDSAKQKIAELENKIRDSANKQSAHSPLTNTEPAATSAEASNQPLQLIDNLLKTVKADLPFSKRQAEPEPASTTTHPANDKLLAEKDAAIEKLKSEVSDQQNHIARLEREIEAIQDQARQKTSAPDSASSEEQSVSEKTGANLIEGLLGKANLSAFNETYEKVTHFPQDMKQQWVDPIKEKLDDTTDKAKQAPEQIKGMIQKLNPFK